MKLRRIGRKRGLTIVLLTATMIAASVLAGVGGQSAPAAAADECMGYLYPDIDDAKDSFKDRCGRSWNDQVKDQCTWGSTPANGWACHTHAPDGPPTPQLPLSSNTPDPDREVVDQLEQPSSNVCMGYHYPDIGDAKDSFKDECGRSWNSQVRDQCRWGSKPANGWTCHTHAPGGPPTPHLPPGSAQTCGFAYTASKVDGDGYSVDGVTGQKCKALLITGNETNFYGTTAADAINQSVTYRISHGFELESVNSRSVIYRKRNSQPSEVYDFNYARFEFKYKWGDGRWVVETTTYMDSEKLESNWTWAATK